MKTCPSCGHRSDGAFCAKCGTSLSSRGGGACASCGASLQPGARFCTKCGQEAGAGSGGGGAGSNLPWYLLGAAIAALALLLVFPFLKDNTRPDPSAAAPFAGAGGAGTPPPLTGNPREQADALFNRIMQAKESGDSAGAVFFTPMAIDAYGMVLPLDDDGRFHLALVHTVAGNFDQAVATAEEILAGNPNHLLALAAAAEASAVSGNMEAARGYARRFLDAYPTEKDRQLQEYIDHGAILPEYEADARALVAGS